MSARGKTKDAKSKRRRVRQEKKAKAQLGRKSSIELHADGSQTLHLDERTAELVKNQLDHFKKRFGREPKPHEPIFFDEDLPVEAGPVPIQEAKLALVQDEIVEAMTKAGIDPGYIYVYRRTGWLLTDENRHLFSPEDLDFWNSCCVDYETLQDLELATGRKWTDEEVLKISRNPAFTGIGPYPRLFNEEAWTDQIAELFEEEGPEGLYQSLARDLSCILHIEDPEAAIGKTPIGKGFDEFAENLLSDIRKAWNRLSDERKTALGASLPQDKIALMLWTLSASSDDAQTKQADA